MFKKTVLVIMTIFFGCCIQAQQEFRLFDETIPWAKPIENRESSYAGADGNPRIIKVSEPTLTVFLPPKEKANGTAVIICPGGGYHHLTIVSEGYDVAKMFNDWGVTAFVLKYRLPDDSTMERREIGPLQDAQRAIQITRMNAAKWNIDPNKIGIMGFSAGGHLASTLGTHYEKAFIPNESKTNLRPDFMILIYPVISLADSISKFAGVALGPHPSPGKVKLYSNELQVNEKTPPTFIVQAKDDKAVDVRNSIYFYNALQKHHIRSELHLYEKGGHGFGLNNTMSDDKWTDWLKAWMKGYLKKD